MDTLSEWDQEAWEDTLERNARETFDQRLPQPGKRKPVTAERIWRDFIAGVDANRARQRKEYRIKGWPREKPDA